jgi:hypothetical protein
LRHIYSLILNSGTYQQSSIPRSDHCDARELFDLSQEKDELRERYGRNTFGQSCLMARRLVEHGVPYVTINYKGWDTHKQHFETMRRKLPEMDAGMATLLQDRHEDLPRPGSGIRLRTKADLPGDHQRTQFTLSQVVVCRNIAILCPVI